jgi:hypothetical protein
VNHLRIPEARRVAWSKNQTGDPQVIGYYTKLGGQATWQRGFFVPGLPDKILLICMKCKAQWYIEVLFKNCLSCGEYLLK